MRLEALGKSSRRAVLRETFPKQGRAASAAPEVAWPGRPAWVEIDLDAIAHNVAALLKLIRPARLIAVVKANGYGHGSVAVASAAVAAGASSLAVACVDEGVELRRAGIAVPILVMGHTPPLEAARVLRHRLTATLDTPELGVALSAAAVERGAAAVHLKVDTGMGRFGLLPGEVIEFVQRIHRLPGLRIEGIYTHFARADEADKTHCGAQFAAFIEVTARLAARGISIPFRHAANTAAALDCPEMRLDGVRCGIGIVGLYPSEHVSRPIELRPALQLKARLARVRRLKRGSTVGYGGGTILDHDGDVGLIPLGYADGLPRSLGNRGAALVGGRRVPMIGPISMDQTTVLLNEGPGGGSLGDEVVLLGAQGGRQITAEEMAAAAGTIHYEIMTGVPPRLPRVYSRAGRPIQAQTLLGTWVIHGNM